MDLLPELCSHCGNLRRDETARMLAEGKHSPDEIADYVRGLRCRGHIADEEERRKKEARKTSRQAARLRKR
jgi:hypothetical protein